MAAVAEEEGARTTENKSGGFDIRIIAIGLVFLLAAMGGSYFIAQTTLSPFLPKEETKATEKEKESAVMVPLGEFTVNIEDVSGPRYLKTEIYIETTDQTLAGGGEGGGSEALMPVIKDEILSILSSKTAADLDVRNRDELKKEIKTRLNKKLGGNKVLEVYFTTFIMQ